METGYSNSLTECLFTYSSLIGVKAFDKSAKEFFQKNFSKEISEGANLFEIFDSSIAAQIYEKLLVCKNGKFQLLSLQNEKTNFAFNFYISPILGIREPIDTFSISVEITGKNSEVHSMVEMQKELDHSKQFYSNLFYNNPDAVYAIDMYGNFINANKLAAQFAETTEDKLIGTSFLPFIPKEDHQIIFEKFENVKHGAIEIYQCSFIGYKGTSRILQVSNFPIRNNDRIIGVYGIAKDITEQRKAERKVLEERQMLRAIIDNIPDYIFVKDKQHKSILANKKFYTNILGKKSDESAKGYTPLDYFEKDKGGKIIADNELVMTSGNSVINRPDIVTNIHGEQEMVLLTKVPLKNSNNETIGIVGIARDITETYQHNKRQDLIYKIIKVFGEKLNLQEAIAEVLKIFCETLNFDYAEAYKISFSNEKLIRTSFWPEKTNLDSNSNQFVKYEKGEALPGRTWESGKVEIVTYNNKVKIFKEFSFKETEALQTAVGVPIKLDGKLISIFCFGSKSKNRTIEIDILNDVSLQLASALESKRSQEQLNDFFNFSPNLIAIIGMDGFIKQINPSFERNFGYTRQEILSTPFTNFIHPDDLQKTYEAIEKTSIDGNDLELRCRKKEGGYNWISWRFSRFQDLENVVYIYGTDISELKNNESQLENSEKRFKALVQEGSDHIAIVDCKYNYLYNSPASEAVFGMSPIEMNNTNFQDHIYQDDVEQIVSELEKLEENKRIQLSSYRIQTQDGVIRWIETIVTNLSEEAAVGGIVMNSRDITEFILQEKKLIQSLRRYDIVAKATSDIITDYNIEKDEIQVSDAAAEVFGYKNSTGKFNGEWWNDKIHPDDYKNVRDSAQWLINEGKQNLTIEYRFRCADGSYKFILDRSYLLKSDSGTAERIIGSMQDITEMKKYLIEIENNNQRLKEIAWTQSHLVRAPLAKIMGLVDLLINYQKDFKNIDEILEKILYSTNELDTIIRKIAVQTEKEL